MTCDDVRPLLSAHLDRELDLGASLEVDRHLQTCTGCATLFRRYEDLRAAVRDAPLVFSPPPGLHGRILKQMRRPRGTAWLAATRWRWVGLPLAAGFAAALSWSVALHTATSRESPILTELVTAHVRSLMVDHIVDVASSDQHTVKPWFNGKVDFAPPVTDFTAQGFPLIGGRLDYIAAHEVAVLIYKRRQHAINVFIWPFAKDDGSGSDSVALQGYHLRRWTASGLTFWGVSDVNGADLDTLAALFQGTS